MTNSEWFSISNTLWASPAGAAVLRAVSGTGIRLLFPSASLPSSLSLNYGPTQNNCLILPLLEEIVNIEYATQQALWREVRSCLSKANTDLWPRFRTLSKHGWCAVCEWSCLIAGGFLPGLKMNTSSCTLCEMGPGWQIGVLISL